MDERDPTEIVLQHLSVLRVEPGDTLVLRSSGRMSTEQYQHLTAAMKEHFGQVKCIVLEAGLDLGVVRFGAGEGP